MNKFLNTKNNLDLFEKDEYLKSDRLEDFYSINVSNHFRVLDLFCGCGGISLGLKRDLKLSQEQIMTEILWLLLKKTQILKFLISTLINIPENNIFENIDVLVGGPCQGFSLTGTRVKDDPRNKLYAAFLKAIDILKPKIVLIENVKGMSYIMERHQKNSE